MMDIYYQHLHTKTIDPLRPNQTHSLVPLVLHETRTMATMAFCTSFISSISSSKSQALSAALDLPELQGLVLMSTSSRVSSRARQNWRRSAQVAREQGQEAWAKIQEMVAESQIEKEMPKLSRELRWQQGRKTTSKSAEVEIVDLPEIWPEKS